MPCTHTYTERATLLCNGRRAMETSDKIEPRTPYGTPPKVFRPLVPPSTHPLEHASSTRSRCGIKRANTPPPSPRLLVPLPHTRPQYVLYKRYLKACRSWNASSRPWSHVANGVMLNGPTTQGKCKTRTLLLSRPPLPTPTNLHLYQNTSWQNDRLTPLTCPGLCRCRHSAAATGARPRPCSTPTLRANSLAATCSLDSQPDLERAPMASTPHAFVVFFFFFFFVFLRLAQSCVGGVSRTFVRTPSLVYALFVFSRFLCCTR